MQISKRKLLNWFTGKESLIVFVFSVAFHLAAINKWGIHTTGDYTAQYLPLAKDIVLWVQSGHVPLDEIGGLSAKYGNLTHFVWILVVSIFHYFFRESAPFAIVIFNIALTSLLYSMLVVVCVRSFKSRAIAIVSCLMLNLFWPNFYWVLFTDPGCLFRFLFFIFLGALVCLYKHEKYWYLNIFSLIFLCLLSMVRVDAVVLFLPVMALSIVGMSRLYGKTICGLMTAFVATVFIGIAVTSGLLETLWYEIIRFVIRGEVVLGDGTYFDSAISIEALDGSRAKSFYHLVVRFLKLFVLRVYYYLGPIRIGWPEKYMIYHGLYLVVVYILCCFGIFRLRQSRNVLFAMFFFIFVASIFLHGISRIDFFLRTGLTPFTFLIVFAGYGMDEIWARLKMRLIRCRIMRTNYK
jgi:hypothetical protein